MAEIIHNPHDKLVHAVLGEVASATSFSRQNRKIGDRPRF